MGYVHSMHEYSAEHRQVAAQHYLDHDRCIASTMKAPGYRCREVLTACLNMTYQRRPINC